VLHSCTPLNISGLYLARRTVRSTCIARNDGVAMASRADITGNALSANGLQSDGMVLLDEAIMNMITFEADPIPQLQACMQIDGNCGMVNCLLAFQLLRNPPIALPTADGNSSDSAKGDAVRHSIPRLLSNLEANYASLSPREQYFASAALAWSQGGYSRCSALLESAVLLSPGDTLALRLAQDCYQLTGDVQSSLGCITRCLQTLDDSHFLHAHLMGMLAAGYLENGLLVEAEETSARAVSRSKGRDVWALHTLLSCLQLSGRSSEVLAALEEHESRHEGTGLHYLLFNKGSALIQRGNYRGALRVYDDMILLLVREPSNRGERLRSSTALAHATLLLWQVCLNAGADSDSHLRWSKPELLALWREVDLSQHSHSAMLDLCKGMALAGISSCEGLKVSSVDGGSSEPAEPEAPRNLLSWLTSNVRRAAPAADAAAGGGGAEGQSEVEGEKGRKDGEAPAAESSAEPREDGQEAAAALLEQHLHGLHAPKHALAEGSYSYSNLLAVQPTFTFETRGPELRAFCSSKQASEKAWQLSTCGEDTVRALVSFSAGDFSSAAERLNALRPALTRLGGTAVQRDVVAYTLIEAFMRSNKLTEARLLLCERTALAPNEGQSWRRLASVFGKTGMQQLAEGAHYTAWQLGIGQGGFGGAK